MCSVVTRRGRLPRKRQALTVKSVICEFACMKRIGSFSKEPIAFCYHGPVGILLQYCPCAEPTSGRHQAVDSDAFIV